MKTAWDALMRAAGAGKAEDVAQLLEDGAPADQVDAARGLRRPLLQCLFPGRPRHEGHVACARLLLEAGADVDKPGHFQSLPPLRMAAATGYEPLVALLLEAGATLDLWAAAALYRGDALRAMLEDDSSLVDARDVMGRTALHALASSRHWRNGEDFAGRALEAARVLIEAGAALDAVQEIEGKYQGTPLWWAVSYGRDVGLIGWLLERGAEPRGCMVAAAYQGAEAVLDLLVAAGAEVDARDVRGHTALQHVLLFKRPAAVPWLLSKGADPNVKAAKGYTALHLAAMCGHEAGILEALVEAGGDLEARDDAGRNALEAAQASGKEAAAEWLASRCGET